ncbi:Type 1 glutamine amidotransferase-like domain-containing protein [Candidatus Parcubacteria bacterium]|nr:Type 1 glutamine amidotransferase-like domain-containing protein [Candidatus Parcubacteria bacterium]
MKTIVAIGGGEIGRPGFSIETKIIDKEIIKYSGKKNPKLLFIPTASFDASSYIEDIKRHFGKRLGCKVDVLYLIDTKITKKEIERKMLSSDIIYVGRGNTVEMLKVWKDMGVDKLLKKAWEKGVVISGLSAGAVCWFKYFSSDSKKFKNRKFNFDFIKLKGLGWIPISFCPHFDTEKKRREHLKKMMEKTAGTAIAVDNCCALVIRDDEYKIVLSKKNACAHKAFWFKGKYHISKIMNSKKFKPLNELLTKY